ncbi:MAG: nucleotidyl transferase AbiEii/AbiGii toxin family protein [Candidatus Babeliales bacterium]
MTRNPEFHKNILVSILKDIFRDTSLTPYLGFKGGTAAMLFYGLPRFSVDLDFDLLNEPDEKIIFEGINRHIEKYGIVKKAYDKRYTLFFLLSYEGKVPNAANIKVEINKRQFGSQYHIMNYLGIPMRVMVKTDMSAHKLMAMYNRLGNANRDIYDVWYFLKEQWPINQDLIQSRTGMPYQDFLVQVIEALEKFDDKQILTGLGELLSAEQRKWVQANLKVETLFYLKLALQNIKDTSDKKIF